MYLGTPPGGGRQTPCTDPKLLAQKRKTLEYLKKGIDLG